MLLLQLFVRKLLSNGFCWEEQIIGYPGPGNAGRASCAVSSSTCLTRPRVDHIQPFQPLVTEIAHVRVVCRVANWGGRSLHSFSTPVCCFCSNTRMCFSCWLAASNLILMSRLVSRPASTAPVSQGKVSCPMVPSIDAWILAWKIHLGALFKEPWGVN